MLATAANACEVGGEEEGVPNLVGCPVDVASFLKRAVICQHFAGEITGDASERGREVNAKLIEHQCDSKSLKPQRLAFEKRYASDPTVAHTVQKIFRDYAIEE